MHTNAIIEKFQYDPAFCVKYSNSPGGSSFSIKIYSRVNSRLLYILSNLPETANDIFCKISQKENVDSIYQYCKNHIDEVGYIQLSDVEMHGYKIWYTTTLLFVVYDKWDWQICTVWPVELFNDAIVDLIHSESVLALMYFCKKLIKFSISGVYNQKLDDIFRIVPIFIRKKYTTKSDVTVEILEINNHISYLLFTKINRTSMKNRNALLKKIIELQN